MRELKEKSFSTREALTMALELCESQEDITNIIQVLKNKPSIDDDNELEERFNKIANFIKKNVYQAKFCQNCGKWYFADDYNEDFDIIYSDEHSSCIFCQLQQNYGGCDYLDHI